MKKTILITVMIVSLFALTTLISRSFRPTQIPNGNINTCNNCHVTPGGPRNDFGKLVEARFLTTSPGGGGDVVWGPLLASLDADNDGVSNGEELQDPFGLWTSGPSRPGDPTLVSLPGSSHKHHAICFDVSLSAE